ncbi:hypothetical protein J6590_056237 [Homalodisca vitripennis]|nr:hypothetical protein J6590_056237 [Homalodisca vitripennis]
MDDNVTKLYRPRNQSDFTDQWWYHAIARPQYRHGYNARCRSSPSIILVTFAVGNLFAIVLAMGPLSPPLTPHHRYGHARRANELLPFVFNGVIVTGGEKKWGWRGPSCQLEIARVLE